jgi:hypothetical protein
VARPEAVGKASNMKLKRAFGLLGVIRGGLCVVGCAVSASVLAQPQCLVAGSKTALPVRQLFVVAGQSNAAGLASVWDVVGGAEDVVQEGTVFPNVNIYGIYGAPAGVQGKDDGTLSASVAWSRFASWKAAQPGFGFKNVKAYANQFPAGVTEKQVFGPELFLARYLNDRAPRDHYIAKLAVSNSSLNTVDGLDNWVSGGHLSTELLKIIAEAHNTKNTKVNLQVAGLFWMQGETDALNEKTALQYKSNLTAFIKTFRQALVGMKCSDDANVPVVLGRIQDNPVWVHRKHVRAAQDQVAREVPNVSVVDTDDFSPHLVVGGVHFNEIAQARLGERVFRALTSPGHAKKE